VDLTNVREKENQQVYYFINGVFISANNTAGSSGEHGCNYDIPSEQRVQKYVLDFQRGTSREFYTQINCCMNL
jgi:hypothetical protein